MTGNKIPVTYLHWPVVLSASRVDKHLNTPGFDTVRPQCLSFHHTLYCSTVYSPTKQTPEKPAANKQ